MEEFLINSKETSTLEVSSSSSQDKCFILVDNATYEDTAEPRRMLLEPENNDEEPGKFQQKLRQLAQGKTRSSEAVAPMSKLMKRIVKLGDAITRETERLEAGIPSTIIAPPPIRVPETSNFSEDWYTDTNRLLMATSMEMAALTIKELSRIKRELCLEYTTMEAEYKPTEADCEQIWNNVKYLTEGYIPGEPIPTGVNLPLQFYIHAEEGSTFIGQNPELHTVYNTAKPLKGILSTKEKVGTAKKVHFYLPARDSDPSPPCRASTRSNGSKSARHSRRKKRSKLMRRSLETTE